MQVLDTVLLVDDDEAANYFHHSLINKLGLARDIILTSNGKDALNFIEEKYYSHKSLPSLILIDIAMPDMNGIELIKKLKASDLLGVRKIPVAIVSISEHEKYKEDLSAYGNFNYVTKPLSEFKFIDILKNSVIPSLYSENKIFFINSLHKELAEQVSFLRHQHDLLKEKEVYLSKYSKEIIEKINKLNEGLKE